MIIRASTTTCCSLLFLSLWFAAAATFGSESAPPAIALGSKFAAADTLTCGEEDKQDAAECIDKLSWRPTKFEVALQAAAPGCGNFLVRFPSAKPIGDSANDLVSMEWFAAQDPDGTIRNARSIVVVHESGRKMTVGRLIARGLSTHGLHASLLHLPGYGARRVATSSPSLDLVLPALQQAIADARRARDAVAALPVVDRSVIGLQGTSLGGFVTATVAGLDDGYQRVFILLAGGELQEVVLNGSKDAAKLRQKLTAAGVTEQQIKRIARDVEPLRLAHRINPAGTWLYSGRYDDVVPRRCSLALAKAARLSDDHHIELPVDHYSGILYLPQVVQQVYQHMIEPIDASAASRTMPEQ
jgi:dienelactone hydrolase